jgi:PTH2 family peptidyl-tRNA hydrolase
MGKNNDTHKQVIVLRTDLNMRKGKMIAQGAHASMKVLLDRLEIVDDKDSDFLVRAFSSSEDIESWISGSFTKIVVGVSSEEELLKIYSTANNSGVLCSLIRDNGHTEFNGVPTYTAVAVGPGTIEGVSKITGHLKLL